MYKHVYLTGDNHSSWQQELQEQARQSDLAISFRCPHKQSEQDEPAAEAISDIAGARCVEAVNDALLSGSGLVVVRFDNDSDHRHALAAAAQAIVKGKPIVVLHDTELAEELSGILRVATAVAGNMAQLLSILGAWNNNRTADSN